MATTFYLRNSKIAISGYNFLAVARGAVAASLTVNTVGGATWIPINTWVTAPLNAFTLSGTINIQIRASENNNAANAGIECRMYKWSPSSGLSGAFLTLKQATELSTTDSSVTLSGTPTTTTFNNGDAIVITVGITNIGTMGGSRTVTMTYDGPSANVTGDSYVTINENVVLKNRLIITE